MALQRLWKGMSRHYQKNVAGSLSEFGLKYDDIKIEQDADFVKALDRLPQCVQIKSSTAASSLKNCMVKKQSRDGPHLLVGLPIGLPHAELQLRARRTKRAFDVSFKRKALPPDLKTLQKPLEGYALPLVEEAKARRVERELLNTM